VPPVQQHVEWWTKQAAHNLEIAKSNRQNGYHDAWVLMSQQAAEKYLKALFMQVQAATPPKVHQCDKLAAMLGAPPSVLSAAQGLEKRYIECRYPDAAHGVPFEKFDDKESERHLKAAEEVQRWVLQHLGQQR
jgi:HEPN domain-containing protein